MSSRGSVGMRAPALASQKRVLNFFLYERIHSIVSFVVNLLL